MIDISALDVTKTNAAVDRLLEVTNNPRHRFMLGAYHRHRYLEIAGRYEELFAPEMMVEHPVYHFNAVGIDTKFEGAEAIRSLYRTWTQTNQTTFYVESEEIAVADHYIASLAVAYQQVWGKAVRLNRTLGLLPRFLSDRALRVLLSRAGTNADENDMYLLRVKAQMNWQYDDRCRLIGEDVWEMDPDQAELIRLDPSQILTPAEAARHLNPLIKPLAPFEPAFALS